MHIITPPQTVCKWWQPQNLTPQRDRSELWTARQVFSSPNLWGGHTLQPSLCLYHPSSIQPKGPPSSSSCVSSQGSRQGRQGCTWIVWSLGLEELRSAPRAPLLDGNEVMSQWEGEKALWLIKEEGKWMEMGRKESILESRRDLRVAYSSKWKGSWGEMIQGVSDLCSELKLQF